MATYDFVGGNKPPPKTNVVAEANKAHIQRINKNATKEEIIKSLPLEFAVEDIVQVRPECITYATEYSRIKDTTFTVSKVKMADLGDMASEVLYLKDSEGNPYLAKHFKKV
jgi:hypothetical protein